VDTDYKDEEEINKLLMACPAGCYTYVDGVFGFSHLGCLECGTCRILSHGKIVKDWKHPQGEVGVTFRQG
ncbi:ferredoxin family protein, partial [Anaerococcus obesiensis]